LQIIYDTNILLQILRNADSMNKLQARLGYRYLEECISIVNIAEIRSLSVQFNCGKPRIEQMMKVLADLPAIDINSPEVIDKYVEIDCYSKRKHPTLVSDFSAIKMGKNDLWIAATASVYQRNLLTTDLDFQHLHGKFIDITYVDNSIFTGSSPSQ
jgi:tRNA(fMet)-specific endonuclease VapC